MSISSHAKAIFFLIASALLAALVGVLLADWADYESLTILAAVAGILLLPLVRTWHYPLLVFTVGSNFIFGFLPTSPTAWSVFTIITLGFAWVDKTIAKRREPVLVKTLSGVSWAIVFLILTFIVTGFFRDDFGGQIFGSSRQGVRKYFSLLMGCLAYFALSSRTIAPSEARTLVPLFFASQIFVVFVDVIWAMGPIFHPLFMFLAPPIELSTGSGSAGGGRLVGLCIGSLGTIFTMLSVYGVTGIFASGRIWRPILFVSLLGAGLLGGYRSFLILVGGALIVCGFLEGFFKRWQGQILILVAVLLTGFVLVFADSLPKTIQRAVAFLPVEVDPSVRADVEYSTKWRIEMWEVLLPEIPKWLLMGKGYGFFAADLYIVEYRMSFENISSNERSLLLGDYHSGPLTLLVPFGLPGLIGAVAFFWFSLRYLHRVYRSGDPALKKANTFLLGYFVTRLLHFIFIYGQFNLDLIIFTSIVGFSVALNRRQLLGGEAVGGRLLVTKPAGSEVAEFGRR